MGSGGQPGRLFREFAVTLSSAVMISLVISLTTTPMLCALLLPRHALVRLDGLWAESFWPGPAGFAALAPAARQRLLRAFPALAAALYGALPVEAVYSPRARPVALRREVGALLARLPALVPGSAA